MIILTNSTADSAISPSMQQRIIERVQANPDKASAWRMLGKVQLQNGDRQAAEESFRRAISLEPLNAAAHHDLGQLLIENRLEQEGLRELQTVLELAPESEYANSALVYLELWGVEPTPDVTDPAISLVGFEAGEFDGSERRKETDNPLYEPLEEPEDVFDTSFDIGLRYNSNVALAPTSRQLSPGTRESFQLLLSPDLEYRFAETETSRWGLTYYGQWTFNEGNFREFNLQSFQPGIFWEADIDRGSTYWIPRLSYEFIHDQFDGETFGNRHAATASTLAIWDDINSTYFYYAADLSSFADQGATPALDSQDGWSHTLGASHEWYWRNQFFRSFTLGTDLQRVDTDGSDFRYHGIQFFAETTFVPSESWEWSLGLGAGYRDYFDFSGEPARDEFNWRGEIELEKKLSEQVSILTFFRYLSFNSDNALFDADQYLTGMLTQFEF